MKALGKYIVITEKPAQVKRTDGGLELTDKHTDDIRYIEATVASPGLAVEGVDVGDEILYDRHAGHGIELDGKFYKVIREGDVVMVL